VEREIRRVEAEGWKYQEMVGKELKGAEVMIHMSADTARSLNVKVRSDGQDVSREYLQETNLYYASIFMAPQGGSFAIVFSRSRP